MKNRVSIICFLLFVCVLCGDYQCAWPQERQTRRFQIKSADPSTLVSVIETLKSDEGKVVYDRNTNSLIVIDFPHNLDRIDEVIADLDQDIKQVRIEVLITEASESFLSDQGLKSAYVVIPSGEFSALVNLIEKRKDANIRSRSSVLTLSNRPARIQVTEDALIGYSQVIYPSGSSLVIPERKPVGSILEVLPRVNADRTITMYINPSLSTFEDSSAVPFERSVSTQVVVNDGDTVVLGGLDSGHTSVEHQSTVFGIRTSKTKKTGSRNTVMFLTAHIED